MTTELCFLMVSEASALLRAGMISPVDLTRACFDRIRKLDGELNAFILPLEEPAMADAKRAEEEIAGGDWKGSLHGIPIGLKDIYNTAGVATTGHSALFKDHVPAEWLLKTPELYGERGRLRIMAGAFVTAADYVNAQRERARLVAEVAATMRDVDLLMMPTRQMVAPILGGYDSSVGASLTRPLNMTGYPALSICNGFSAAGLPVSLQIAGRPFEDHLVLKAGDAFEKATSFRTVRPNLASSSKVATD